MFNQSLHFLPDGFDRNDFIIATYFIEICPEKDIIDFCETLAVDMSTGTWTAVEGETEEMRKTYAAKVISISEVPDFELELPPQIAERRYITSIGVPLVNIGSQVPMLLTTIIGNVSVMGRIKLVDIELPPGFLGGFKGPKFGIQGIRDLLGVPKRPFLNNMIKPCTGFMPEVGAEFFYRAAAGGVDIIKDDELLSETPYNNRLERIRLYMEMVKRAYEVKGEKTLYAVNITDRADKLLENAKRAIDAGANALMINYLTQGISSMQSIAENPDINVPILAHLDFSGVLYANPYGGLSSHLVLGKLARIAGADMIVYPIESGKYRLLDTKYRRIAHNLLLPLKDIKTTLPIPAGGLSAKLVPKIINDIGFDCAISAGGSIHGHPMGAVAGARALRDAIDAVMEGISLAEYAEEHRELKAALEKWKE